MSYPDNIQFRRLLLHKTSPAAMIPRLGSLTTKILRYHFQSKAFLTGLWFETRSPGRVGIRVSVETYFVDSCRIPSEICLK